MGGEEARLFAEIARRLRGRWLRLLGDAAAAPRRRKNSARMTMDVVGFFVCVCSREKLWQNQSSISHNNKQDQFLFLSFSPPEFLTYN